MAEASGVALHYTGVQSSSYDAVNATENQLSTAFRSNLPSTAYQRLRQYTKRQPILGCLFDFLGRYFRNGNSSDRMNEIHFKSGTRSGTLAVCSLALDRG
jgi:hypothetical protein